MKYRAAAWMDNLNSNIIPYIDGDDYEVRYFTLKPYCMSEQEYGNLQNTAREIYRIMSNLAQQIIDNGDQSVVDILNMTPEITPFILDDRSEYVSNIARLDFVKEAGSGLFKLTEINADTPCAMPEAYYANQIAESYFAPDKKAEDIYGSDLAKPFLEHIAKRFAAAQEVNIVCAANKQYLEDWANAAYVRRIVSNAVLPLEKSCFVYMADLQDLQIKEDGVYITNAAGKEIKADILYRLHPIELLAEDVSEDGYPVGKKLMDLANMEKVILVNPVKALLLQNKALMAITKLLAETGYFNDFDKFIIKNYLPDTSLEAEHFHNRKFIKKPIFGREGCNISIVEADGTFSYEAEESDDCDNIYQEFIKSELVSCETDAGLWEGKLTYSCFIINGQASQVFIRFSPYDIAGTEALCIPVVKK